MSLVISISCAKFVHILKLLMIVEDLRVSLVIFNVYDESIYLWCFEVQNCFKILVYKARVKPLSIYISICMILLLDDPFSFIIPVEYNSL